MRGRAVLTAVALGATAITSFAVDSGPASAATPPDGFTDAFIAPFSTPTTVEWLPGNRIVVLEQTGDLLVGRPGGSFSTAASFLPCSDSERGLLGLTPDPGFLSNGHVYVYYTPFNGAECVNRVSRFTMIDDEISLATEVILLDNIASTGSNHNGGDLDIGADGHLYVAIGDAGTDPRFDSGGGGSNDAAQDLSLLNGKIARITLDGDPAPGNPFTGVDSAPCATLGTTASPTIRCQEIYSWGLRNPYRFAFDRDGGSNRFYINDVGQVTYEEVNEGAIGDFGWPGREGPCPQGFTDDAPECTAPAAGEIDPISAYGRGDGIYITAGAFVPDNLWPAEFDDLYLFADGGSGDIWQMDGAGEVDYATPFATGAFGITDMTFGFDEDGIMVLYYVGQGLGLRSIRPVVDDTPPPDPSSGLEIDPVTPFRAYDTGDGTGVPGGEIGDVVGGTQRVVDLDPPVDVQAALVNITMANTAGAGFVRTWAPPDPRPETSSVNANRAGATVGNAVIVPLTDAGSFVLEAATTTRIVVDVMAWLVDTDGSSDDGRFVALDPARLIDTREPAGAMLGSGSSNPFTRTGNDIDFDVAGHVDVPDDGTAAAAVLSVAALPRPGLQGRATLVPAGTADPGTASVNVTPGDIRNNLVIVPLAGGADDVTAITLNLDDLVVDVLGFVTSDAADVSGSGLYLPIPATRIVDTRDDIGFEPLTGGVTTPLDVPDGDGNSSVVQTITVTNASADGWIVAHPQPTPPVVSNLNYRTGDTRGSLAFGRLSAEGRQYFTARVATDVVVDMVGVFTE